MKSIEIQKVTLHDIDQLKKIDKQTFTKHFHRGIPKRILQNT